MSEKPTITGACYCGAVKYTITAPINDVYICHCTQCRRQSASAFGISCSVPFSSFKLLQTAENNIKYIERKTASGTGHQGMLCAECGTRIWNRSDSARAAGITYIKGGTVDGGIDLTEAVHIWVKEKLPGVLIPAKATQYEEEPPAD